MADDPPAQTRNEWQTVPERGVSQASSVQASTRELHPRIHQSSDSDIPLQEISWFGPPGASAPVQEEPTRHDQPVRSPTIVCPEQTQPSRKYEQQIELLQEFEQFLRNRSSNPKKKKPKWSLAATFPENIRPDECRCWEQGRSERTDGPDITPAERRGNTDAAPPVASAPQPISRRNRDQSQGSRQDETASSPHGNRQKPQQESEPKARMIRLRGYRRKFMAEFLGTFVTITIGLCANLSVTTSKKQAGTYLSTNLAWGFATMMGVYVAGGISGAHLNPAVSLVLWIFRGLPASALAYYIPAQLLASLAAGGVAYAVYMDSIHEFGDHGGNYADTADGLLYTLPKHWLHPVTAFFNEFVATSIFGCGILALGDAENTPPGVGMHPLIIGLFISALSMAFGHNTNNCLNPARDIGPRIIARFSGYNTDKIWTSFHWWWAWGPWPTDVARTIFGAFLYDLCCFSGRDSPVFYPLHQWEKTWVKGLRVLCRCVRWKSMVIGLTQHLHTMAHEHEHLYPFHQWERKWVKGLRLWCTCFGWRSKAHDLTQQLIISREHES